MRTESIPPGRPPLDAAALNNSAVRPGGLWHAVQVTARTGSTNADLLERARDGAPEGLVLVAEEQTSGRGRMGRAWVSPPGAALTFSLLLRPAGVPPARRGWLPLLAGVAVATAVRAVSGVGAQLKWPNDVLVGEAKLAGILAEQAGSVQRSAAEKQESPQRSCSEKHGGAIVVGIGINVSTTRAELPSDRAALAATSLLIEGAASLSRGALLVGVLSEFERRYPAWNAAGGDPDACGLRTEYLRLCATLGRQVRVELPGGQHLSGVAADIDPDGRLAVREASGAAAPLNSPAGDLVAVAAGDVVHVR
jgi:BirA family transcriptional regulator, biotin operon repressor / biotin---[acetyl-CoA-carboxylase] ligase